MNSPKNMNMEEHREVGRGRKAFWVVTGLVVFALIVSAGCSRRGRDTRGFFTGQIANGEGIERLLDGLDVSPTQRVRLIPVAERFQSRILELRAEQGTLRTQLLAAFENREFESERVARLRNAAVELSDSAITDALEAAVDVWEVLTPEQRAEVLKHWDRRN